MNKRIILGCILMALGGFVIWLPDNDHRLFSISEEHGPNSVDFIGILILLIGYFLIIIKAWEYREKLTPYFETKAYKILVFMSGLGTGLLIASVAGDFRHWWIIGGAILGLVQLIAIYIIFKQRNPTDRAAKYGEVRRSGWASSSCYVRLFPETKKTTKAIMITQNKNWEIKIAFCSFKPIDSLEP